MKKAISPAIYLLLIAVLLFLGSCKKYLTIDGPPNQLAGTDVFTSAASVNAAFTGLYSNIMQTQCLLNDFNTVDGGICADEMYKPMDPNNVYYVNRIPVDYPEINLHWSTVYSFVYVANSILDGLAHSGISIDTLARSHFRGEALFVRAWCHFELTKFWGDVPLIVTKEHLINDTVSRTPQAQVYARIIQDLTEAAMLLPEDYSAGGGEKIRPNKYAALALLARAYLYAGDWAKAETAATMVIDAHQYQVMEDPNAVFLTNSDEAIFQLAPVASAVNSWEAKAFIPSSDDVIPQHMITSQLLASFDAADLRRKDWLDSNVVSGQAYYFPYKYKNATGAELTEYQMIIRYAELFLIRAEARTHLQQFQEAQDDVNVLRGRAKVMLSTADDEASLLTAVEQERRVELFAEGGHRWFDLRRTGRIDAVLGAVKPGWKPTAALWPIPLLQRKANSHLTQNSGY